MGTGVRLWHQLFIVLELGFRLKLRDVELELNFLVGDSFLDLLCGLIS